MYEIKKQKQSKTKKFVYEQYEYALKKKINST